MQYLIKSLLIFVSVFSVESYAASFDCKKQLSVTEQVICKNVSLNDADVKMTTTYNILRRLVPMGTRSVIQDEQVKWLQFRDRCNDSFECLEQVYQMRQQKLNLHLDRVYRNGPY